MKARASLIEPLLERAEQYSKSSFELLKLKSLDKAADVTPDFKGNLIDTTMGVTAGYLSQALIVGASHNPIKKLLGAFLQMGISNVVAKNPETIKSLAGSIINFFKKNNQGKIENS